jgi:hypothetical protein
MRFQTTIKVEIETDTFDVAVDCFEQIEDLIKALYFVKGAVVSGSFEDVTGI